MDTSVKLNYRPDIDGLRAIAVLSVLLFHFKVVPFSGGFVGVDVFFVISGYLITAQIVGDINQDRFSFATFYGRRIRRIAPAAIFTVALVFVGAALLFPADAFRATSRDAIASLLAVSNINFLRYSWAYFAPAAGEIPLLHFWSLSVEEQFYLIWPAGIVLLATYSRRLLMPTIVAVSILSFGLSQIWLARDAAGAFYIMPFRIFEFGIGAIVVFATAMPLVFNRAVGETCLIAGLALIFWPIFAFNDHTPFPGINALFPTIGTALVIFAGNASRLSKILRWRPLVWVGLISYSLYLCHWPLFVFTEYMFGGASTSPIKKIVLVVTSIAIAVAMYFFIEKPFRRPLREGGSNFLRPAITMSICVAIVIAPAYLAFRQGGWKWRISQERRDITRQQAFGYLPCDAVDLHGCSFGAAKGDPALIILGDSFAQHWVAGLDQFLQRRGLRGKALTWGGCPMLPGLRGMALAAPAPYCETSRTKFYEDLRDTNEPILIAQSWPTYIGDDPDQLKALRNGLDLMLQALPRHRFLIVGAQVPAECSSASELFRLNLGPFSSRVTPCKAVSTDKRDAATRSLDAMFEDFRRTNPERVSLLLPQDFLCDKVSCSVNSKNGISMYRDYGHLTVEGSEFIVSAASALLERILAQ